VSEELELTAGIAPPMANGELVFEAPWQARAFGMARALCEQGLYTWDEFREELIAAIARWEAVHAPFSDQELGDRVGELSARSGDGTPAVPSDYAYYDCFVEALETLLVHRGALEANALSERHDALEARPHGHDHHHHHHRH